MGVSLTGGAAPDVSHPCSDRLMVINDKAEWVLSGAKPGNGIECLLDGDVRTCSNLSACSKVLHQ